MHFTVYYFWIQYSVRLIYYVVHEAIECYSIVCNNLHPEYAVLVKLNEMKEFNDFVRNLVFYRTRA